MRRYLAIFIILWYVNLAAGFSPNDIEWASAVSGTLYKGSSLTNGQYMVKAVQFSSPVPGLKDINGNIVPETDVDPMVFLEVYKNGTLIKELVMNLVSEAYVDPDYEVRVSATGFMARNAREWVLEYYNPWATISIQTRALPELDVKVTTDETAYTSYEDQIITATVTVTNSGSAFAKFVDVNLDTGELNPRGGDINQLHRSYSRMEKGASQSFSAILVVPQLLDQKSYNLSANAKGLDAKDIEYRATTASRTITVSPKQNYFTISKAIKDRMYLQNTATVRLTVANGGMYDIYNINITDSMNDNFELKSNTSFQWDIPVLKPGQEWGTTYSIKPLEASLSGFIIPAAAAQFTANNKQYTASSKTITVVVNGPKILLNKTVSKQIVNISEDVNVTVSINNAGDIGTRTEVKDFVPDSVSLVSGATSQLNWSEANSIWGFTYTIRMNKEGTVELPAAVANYTDVEYRGMTRAIKNSPKPVITVVDPTRPLPISNSTAGAPAVAGQAAVPGQTVTSSGDIAPTQTPEPTPPITPGFNSIVALIVMILAAGCLRR